MRSKGLPRAPTQTARRKTCTRNDPLPIGSAPPRGPPPATTRPHRIPGHAATPWETAPSRCTRRHTVDAEVHVRHRTLGNHCGMCSVLTVSNTPTSSTVSAMSSCNFRCDTITTVHRQEKRLRNRRRMPFLDHVRAMLALEHPPSWCLQACQVHQRDRVEHRPDRSTRPSLPPCAPAMAERRLRNRSMTCSSECLQRLRASTSPIRQPQPRPHRRPGEHASHLITRFGFAK